MVILVLKSVVKMLVFIFNTQLQTMSKVLLHIPSDFLRDRTQKWVSASNSMLSHVDFTFYVLYIL